MQENPGNYSSSCKALHFFLSLVFYLGVIVEFDPPEKSVEFSLAPSSRSNVQLVLLTPQVASTLFWKALHCFCLGSIKSGELSLSLPATQMQLFFRAQVSFNDWLCFAQVSSIDSYIDLHLSPESVELLMQMSFFLSIFSGSLNAWHSLSTDL